MGRGTGCLPSLGFAGVLALSGGIPGAIRFGRSGGRMRFTHLKLRNWKNFQAIDTVLVSRMVVYGPNSVGKSNLLDVFRFLRDLAKDGGGLQSAVKARTDYKKIRSLHAHGAGPVMIDVELENRGTKWHYKLEFVDSGREPGAACALVKSEKVWRDGVVLLDRKNTDEGESSRQLSETYLEQGKAGEEFSPVREAFIQIRYLHLVPQLLKYPKAFEGADLPDDPFGRGFLDVIGKTPAKTRDARLNKIEKAIGIAIPFLKSLQYKPERGHPHLIAGFKHWRGIDAIQQETQFSDGTLRLIAILWSLLSLDGLLLLEEPELSLNEEIVKHIPAMLTQVLDEHSDSQVIITTHSLAIAQDEGLALEEVFQINPGRSGSKVQRYSEDSEAVELFNAKLPLSQIVATRSRAAHQIQTVLPL